jgi:formylglycine-generating enzyme required for sulfatase activity
MPPTMESTDSILKYPTTVEAYPGGPVLVALPQAESDAPGTLLGNSSTAYETETSPYRVRVPHRLYMGETVVTFAQWEFAMLVSGCRALNDLGWGKADRPAIHVSWEQAQKYIAWLNKRTGLSGALDAYRLPTEAEWEYACRAGCDGEFSLGPDNQSSLSTDTANFNTRNEGKDSPNKYRGRTVPVKSFPPNAFGLYEMHGNVWEWCDDCYNLNEYDSRQGGNGWLADTRVVKGLQNWRVMRGGSWNDYAENLRSSCRNFGAPDSAYSFWGFRLARTLI